MSILTLWITKDGACGLVKAEILEKAIPHIKKVGYTHKGRHRVRNADRDPSKEPKSPWGTMNCGNKWAE